MRKLTLLLALFLLYIGGCSSPNSPVQEGVKTISFSQLAVGQQSTYIKFIGYGYFSPDSNRYEYMNDTITVKITGKTSNAFVIKEYYSPFSETLIKIRHKEIFLDSTAQYLATVRNDSIIFYKETDNYFYSILFDFIVGELKFDLKDFKAEKADKNGWKTTLSYCECYKEAYTQNFELFGKIYDRLNIIMNDTQMQVDGPGKTYIYSARDGMVRTYIVNWWNQTGIGWDLLSTD